MHPESFVQTVPASEGCRPSAEKKDSWRGLTLFVDLCFAPAFSDDKLFSLQSCTFISEEERRGEVVLSGQREAGGRGEV